MLGLFARGAGAKPGTKPGVGTGTGIGTDTGGGGGGGGADAGGGADTDTDTDAGVLVAFACAAARPRGPAMKEGVLDTARGARFEERKGAGSDRICTVVGRRSDWPCACACACACACPGARASGGETPGDQREGLGWREVDGDGDSEVEEEGGRAGSVTERFMTTPRGRRAGLFGARELRRGGLMMVEPFGGA